MVDYEELGAKQALVVCPTAKEMWDLWPSAAVRGVLVSDARAEFGRMGRVVSDLESDTEAVTITELNRMEWWGLPVGEYVMVKFVAWVIPHEEPDGHP
ncbi:hypothetical protein [Mycobacteroides abscessus]|uniref:hypothetical protein n=1 Tax=Mycobacteroides abscessus TaxID=36809 RepID=UPI000925909C|nr:hypothetical protein [Mycobacteroides abscessus]SIC88254.1 Uncharacterised protein [Mycobacteroides abscessus subsp. bolletii]SKT76067.1 Uncharacterised protein [Mycobacteroides abscessus subsp. bolletii]SLD34660.1 Uncharacterised protein [Mycobacteroides abscessus subsp. bolletii]SLF80051.1 Uncharacterised protein [Mycobacteroides abscessus subsp. bolletii]